MNTQSFSTAIRYKRLNGKRYAMKLRQCAEEIGISTATLSRIENNAVPELDTYYKVCQWLGLPMEEFFKESPNCNPCQTDALALLGGINCPRS